MIGLIHDRTGLVAGIVLNQTTYSPEALELLTSRLGRAEADAARLQAELAALREIYDDRDRDLEYEYTERMAAEAKAEAWCAVATFYADHEDACAITPGRPETCTCGYAAALQRAMATGQAPAPATTPHAVIVALGRATLAYEQARRRDRAYEQRQAYEAALAAAQEAAQ